MSRIPDPPTLAPPPTRPARTRATLVVTSWTRSADRTRTLPVVASTSVRPVTGLRP